MQYLIFLRGINVGGRILKMEEIRNCFVKAGYQNVTTVLQTGNIIIDTGNQPIPKLTSKVESLLKDSFSFDAKVFIATSEQLKKIIDNFSFKNAAPDFHKYAIFLTKGMEAQFIKNAPVHNKNLEKIEAGEGVVYWCVQKGETLSSGIGKYLAKFSMKNFSTSRNLNTLEKVLRKAEGA